MGAKRLHHLYVLDACNLHHPHEYLNAQQWYIPFLWCPFRWSYEPQENYTTHKMQLLLSMTLHRPGPPRTDARD